MATPPATSRPGDKSAADAPGLARDLKMTVRQATVRASVVGITPRQANEILMQTRGGAPTSVVDDPTGLAKQVKKWHADQGDRLPLAQCRHIVAALRGCSEWCALSQRSSGRMPLDDEALHVAIARLKQFGYTALAATALIVYLLGRSGVQGSTVPRPTR